jgi:hypothetical protein
VDVGLAGKVLLRVLFCSYLFKVVWGIRPHSDGELYVRAADSVTD